MRGALTRAMTSAITAKVVNLTLSRASHLPTWSTWLGDWTRDDGATVQLKRIQTVPEDRQPIDSSTAKGSPNNQVKAAAVLS